MMENRFKVRALLSFSPSKLKEKVEKARTKAGRMAHLGGFQGWQALADASSKVNSLSPRKNRLSPGRLFRNARQIAPADTFLPEKTHRLPPTNESSTPHSEHRQIRLERPLTCTRNDRSMSSAGRGEREGRGGCGREIERTVSIVIGGRGQVRTREQLVSALSRIVLGQAPSDDLVMEWLDESSIHGEGQNFVELDSLLLEDIIKLDEDHPLPA